jgi:hypothetical protein
MQTLTRAANQPSRRGREQRVTFTVLLLTTVLTAGLYALLWFTA